MTEQEIRAVVELVLQRLRQDAPADRAPAPQASGEALPDIAAVDLRRQYLVENPHDQAAFLAMKERTPAAESPSRITGRMLAALAMTALEDRPSAT